MKHCFCESLFLFAQQKSRFYKYRSRRLHVASILDSSNLQIIPTVDTRMEETGLTKYEQLLRKIYFNSNVKDGLKFMHALNDALGKPMDDVSNVIVLL